MASEVATVQLGELVDNLDSRQVPLSSQERDQRRGCFPYYGATGVIDYVDGYLVEGLHLLVAEDGSVERPDGKPFVQLETGRFWVNNHMHVLPGATDDETRFLYYALQTVAIRSFMRGSVQAKLSQASLNHIPVPYPHNPAHRRAIAHILGTLDDKIELNRRMNETLEQMARAIFKSWFVDFEPVRAKMSGRWKKGESLPGLPAHLWDLFPDRLVSSALGEIPEGWEISTVGREANIIKGVSYRSKELLESKTAMVTLKSFNRGGGYRPDGLKPYIGDFRKEQIIQPGELIVAQTDVTQAAAVIGKPALVLPDKHFTTLVASLDVLIIRPKTNDLSTEFFYLLFLTSEFEDHIRRHTNGTTVLHLGKNGMPSFRFIKPPPHITYYFSEHVKSIFKQIRMNFEESVVVASIRDTLLPRLINGKM